MRAGRLCVARDDDVESRGASQLRPRFHRDGSRAPSIIARDEQSAATRRIESFAETPGDHSPDLFRCACCGGEIRLWPARARLHEFLFQPVESAQIVAERDLRIAALLGDESDGPAPSAFQNDAQHRLLEVPLRWRHDFRFAVRHHARDVHRNDVRFHAFPDRWEVRDVVVAVAEIIDHPDVGCAELFQPFDDCDFVVGNPEPAVVIIELNLASVRPREVSDGADALRFLLHALLLFGGRFRQRTRAHHPQLRMHVLAFEDFERLQQYRVARVRRRPPARHFHAVLFHRLELRVESGNVLRPPVIDEALEAQPLQHRRALLGPTLLCIKRHRAPRVQVVRSKELLGIRRTRRERHLRTERQ